MPLRFCIPSLFLLLIGCPKGSVVGPTTAVKDAADGMDSSGLEASLDAASEGVTDQDLAQLLRDHWSWTLEANPLWASDLGIRAFDHRIDDNSPEAMESSREQRRGFLERARALDVESLTDSDAVTLTLFLERLETSLAMDECRFEEWSLSPRSNPVTRWNYLPDRHPVDTPEQAERLLKRYGAIQQHIMNEIGHLRRGAEQGLFANAESTRRVIEMVRAQLEEPLPSWPLLEPGEVPRPGWPATERDRFKFRLDEIVATQIKPALESYLSLLEETIRPQARSGDEEGVAALPHGAECYRALIRRHTTLDVSADHIHQVGLAEIERIDQEFRALGKKVFGTDDLASIFERLRGDPKLYFTTEDEVFEAAEANLKAARKAMGKWFGILPRADCIVERIPDYEAPYTTVAYYRQPGPDGSRPGKYYINTTRPMSRPRYEAKVLAYHEAIPGHHLQIAISQELAALPAFRKHGGSTAFVEGWALYTERLADEMGLYPDDLDRFGVLSYDAWRAGRLVVDTGIHAKGWTRERAKQFLAEHSALALNNIDNEVDRYITWPGQALAYKMGQLEILRLRDEAQEQLGEAFDVRAFHDAVLSGGAVSLSVLRRQVQRALRLSDKASD
jgi:uncharacterized protein (DUF885 family)